MDRIQAGTVRDSDSRRRARRRLWRRVRVMLALPPLMLWAADTGAQTSRTLTGSASTGLSPTEVRQIVTFLFEAGKSAEALAIYERQLVPIYGDVASLLRFRGFREAESPEPLDLVVVSSYRGMAGMDAANESLRRPGASGQSAFALYGVLSALTRTHHDQFVEIIASLSDTAVTGDGLTVFEYLRVAPGAHARFERQLATRVRPFEQANHLVQWSETGQMLVSDGWDYLRIYGVRSLGDWHHYLQATRAASFQQALSSLVVTRKTLLLRIDPRLSVR